MSEWIKRSDRLPDPFQAVALLDEDRWMNTGKDDFDVNWHGAGYLNDTFGSQFWSVFGEPRGLSLDAVTHWMPLPPTPNE